MTKLLVILDGNVVDEYRMTRGRITIGRRRHSDILLDNPAVSGNHALIERVGRNVYLEDCESTNGTRLNGKPVRRQRLYIGDEIRIAHYILRYCGDNSSGQPSFEKTMMMVETKPGGGSVDTRPVTTESRPSVLRLSGGSPKSCPPAVLRILGGDNAGREIDLSKEQTSLGRAGVQVAVVRRSAQGYCLERVAGTQALRVNGRDVGAGPYFFADGDEFEMLGVQMAFSFRRGVLQGAD
jgi:pSer/pThr/pTyr-binding forkhead associated (FHA) protein